MICPKCKEGKHHECVDCTCQHRRTQVVDGMVSPLGPKGELKNYQIGRHRSE